MIAEITWLTCTGNFTRRGYRSPARADRMAPSAQAQDQDQDQTPPSASVSVPGTDVHHPGPATSSALSARPRRSGRHSCAGSIHGGASSRGLPSIIFMVKAESWSM